MAETRGSEPASLPSCPGCQDAQCLAVPGVQGEPPSWHHGGQAAGSPWRGSSAHSCSLNSAATDPPRLRHQTRPPALPGDFPTEAELDWHAVLKDSQTSYQATPCCFLLQDSVLVTATQITLQK